MIRTARSGTAPRPRPGRARTLPWPSTRPQSGPRFAAESVIQVDGTYHLFASRWPAQYGLGGWTKYSECVRATSKDFLGPYTFQEVVLQKREDNWDKSRIHNVKIVKAGEESKDADKQKLNSAFPTVIYRLNARAQ